VRGLGDGLAEAQFDPQRELIQIVDSGNLEFDLGLKVTAVFRERRALAPSSVSRPRHRSYYLLVMVCDLTEWVSLLHGNHQLLLDELGPRDVLDVCVQYVARDLPTLPSRCRTSISTTP